MNSNLPKPNPKAIIYEDDKLYACLTTHPITQGHSVIVWKKDIKDLHFLNSRDYDYLMDTVNAVRDAMLKALKVKKSLSNLYGRSKARALAFGAKI